MLCVNCNQETNNEKFCSRHCAAITNNKLYPKRKKLPKESKRNYVAKIRYIKPCNPCIRCGQPTKRKFYCSNQCRALYKFEKRVIEVEERGYIYNSDKFDTSTSFAKRYLRYRYGDICSICKLDAKWNNKPLTLILDHINGITNDWSIANLRLVCPNCDSQLLTFKSKNKGNGRPRKA